MALIEPLEHTTGQGERVVLRSPGAWDAAALIDYLSVIFGEHPQNLLFAPGEFLPTLEQEREWVRAHADSDTGCVLCAFAGQEVVGVLSLDSGSARRTAHTVSLGISLRAAYTGKGLGTRMLHAALDQARAAPGVEIVHLSVFSTNTRAIQFYERMGFVEEGRRMRAIKLGPGDYADEVLLRLDVACP